MRLYEVALTLIPGIGDITAKKLIAYGGGLEAVFRNSRKDFLKNKALGESLIQRVLDGRNEALKRAEKELVFIEKYGIRTLFYLSDDYPYRLLNCPDSPVMLYYKGNADLNQDRIVGVVGTRRATDYGREICLRIVKDLADADVMIVSGLAFGIDSYAHSQALESQLPTVGVLGHGLDRIYPLENKAMAEKMVKQGGLLTDFPAQTIPDRENFPKRNRIIAGLCDALVIVEAANRGGALITADIANSYNRDVFAVPGRVNDEYSKGCNHYIKTHRAALAISADDIKYIMGWEKTKNWQKDRQTKLFAEITDEEKIVVELLRNTPEAGIDFLVVQSGFTSTQVAKILLNLEFKGILRNLPGKRYQLL